MAAMGDSLFQGQLHQFLGGWAHILKALAEGNNGKACAFQVLYHLHSTPAVKGDLRRRVSPTAAREAAPGFTICGTRLPYTVCAAPY